MSLIIYKKSNITVIIKEGTIYQGRVTATIDPTNETVSYQINEGVILTEAWSQTFKEDGSTPIGATLADVIAYNGANLVFNTAPGGSGAIEGGLLIKETGASGTRAASSIFDIQSTSKGVLLPRLTTVQRDAIASPANYLTIVNTDSHRTEIYHPTFGWTVIGYIEPLEVTSVAISFTDLTTYNSVASPGTGNITNNLTGAKKGIIQKIYHNHTSAPTFPAGWVLRGGGIYVPSTLNIIYATFCGGTRVEYWIA